MSTEMQFDRIDREIVIQAPPSQVWKFIAEPGWWINKGAVVPHRIEPDGPGRVLVHDPDVGSFAVAQVAEEPETYVAFRWYCGDSESRRTGALAKDTSTLVEFHVSAEGSGATRVHVVETGFAGLDEVAHQRRAMFDDNSTGWVEELTALRDHFQGARA